MSKTPHTLGAIAVAALMAACASAPPNPPALADARATVQRAERDPQVLESAALELKRATDALRRAEALNAKGDPLAEIESAAYVARSEAETALTLARAKRDEAAMKQAQAERERARAEANAAAARRAQAEAAVARTQALSARTEAVVAQQDASTARAQASDAEARAAAARQEAAQAQTTMVVLQQQLNELQAKQTERGLLVTLGDVLFETGRAEIKPTARGAIAKLAAFLRDHPERRVRVEGYTDSVGDDAYNQVLSQRRADAVAAALGALGVSAARLETRGYGESYPVADNTSATNRALNRRVEIYISEGDQPVRARG